MKLFQVIKTKERRQCQNENFWLKERILIKGVKRKKHLEHKLELYKEDLEEK